MELISLALIYFPLIEALYVTMNAKRERRDRRIISMVVPAKSEPTSVDTSPIAKEIAVRVLKRSDCDSSTSAGLSSVSGSRNVQMLHGSIVKKSSSSLCLDLVLPFLALSARGF